MNGNRHLNQLLTEMDGFEGNEWRYHPGSDQPAGISGPGADCVRDGFDRQDSGRTPGLKRKGSDPESPCERKSGFLIMWILQTSCKNGCRGFRSGACQYCTTKRLFGRYAVATVK